MSEFKGAVAPCLQPESRAEPWFSGVGRLLLRLAFALACSTLFLAACSDKGVSKAPTASLVAMEVWLSGPPPGRLFGAEITSYTITISGCSKAADNRTVVVVPSEEKEGRHLENLTEKSSDCKAALDKFSYGPPETPDVFMPQSGESFAGAKGDTANFVGETTHDSMVVTLESGLSGALEHVENLSFSVMPALGNRRLPDHVLMEDILGTGDAPNFVITAVYDMGKKDKDDPNSEYGIDIVIECAEPKVFSKCGAQEIFDMSFRVVSGLAAAPTLAEAETLIADLRPLIRPNSSHLYANGFRFDLLLPRDESGNFVTEMGFLAKFGDSFRYFTIDVTGILADTKPAQ